MTPRELIIIDLTKRFPTLPGGQILRLADVAEACRRARSAGITLNDIVVTVCNLTKPQGAPVEPPQGQAMPTAKRVLL